MFVWDEGAPSDNNGAERDLRQLATTRKISGGTRSPDGTETKPALSTWAARGLDPFCTCRQLLIPPILNSYLFA